eukprot:CAMPEP_0174379224 /NCGR_PEP_ID=MMETSP0811_2-20130205/122569_1 /TAXON_ID=73025 ORGANISM="Eutreptiella gymnastica-like, Strain CCMP1594" /NCGR_SAMPLE_ID=MMETSP0811_2 /ASSEMBLY_ACC=CAM_ASM_000667 /LENGTH=32 /DNA_ID= /DNA_START= /DNA_END= /DNA_ORIENTATION=
MNFSVPPPNGPATLMREDWQSAWQSPSSARAT